MLLHQFLEESASKRPEKCALVHAGVRYTYGEIEDQANRLACALSGAGIRRGNRVAVFLENSLESVVSLFGILKADAVFLMLSATLKPDKLAYILDHCGVSGLITDSRRIGSVREKLEQLKELRILVPVDQDGAEPQVAGVSRLSWKEIQSSPVPAHYAPRHENIDLDLASIIYTSGSTANPKGVMLTHLNMISAATSITTYLRNRPDDIILDALPLSFDYGLYQVLMAFKLGATVVLEKSFVFPYQILRRMVEEKVTGFPGVPTIFAILLQMNNLKAHDLSALRYITNTAAALPVGHLKQLQECFPQARIYSMYGLTECKRVSYLPPEDIKTRPGSVGKAMPNEEVWIVDEGGRRVGPGVTGELVVRGANVMRGYWRDEEATNAALRPGPLPGERVLHTGDLFRMDEDGYLYFVSRKDDLIKTRGERVSPKEVESALYGMEGILEAAVVPVPDDLLGSVIKAYVVPREGHVLGTRDVILHCRGILEDFAVPRIIEFRDTLPKNASGKIDKRILKGHSV